MLRLSLPALLLFAFAAPARAADTPDPLRLIPESSQLIVKVEKPRQLVEAVVALDVFKTAQNIPQAKAILESANVRRVLQMLAYFERELGAKWPELLDSVAGGGIAIGATLGDEAAPLLVIQGTDPKQTEKAFALLQRVVDEELARAGLPIKVEKESYKGFTIVKVGDFTAAQAGPVLVVSSKGEPVRAALDLIKTGKLDGGALKRKTVQDAKKILPKDPLAWVCVDLVKLKDTQASKDFFENTRKDFLQMLVVGSTIDCVRRSDFVAIGIYQEKTGFRAALRLPAGRSEFTADYALHVPPKDEFGSLPLLEPAGVVYSQSFYLDIGYMWKHRDTLINDEMRKGLEEGEKQLSKLLPGNVKIHELLESWGPRHRLVVLNQEKLPYTVEPAQRLPGFAYVATMRDPKFGKGLESVIRSAGLIGSLQYGIKLKDETHDGIKITGFRFPENKPLDLDEYNYRYNFEPCFCVVDDQFVLASSFEVARKIIPEIKRTARLKGSPAVWQGKAFGDGGADLLTTVADPLITETILGEGVGIVEAKQQIKNLAAYVKQLGTIRVEIDERDTEYRVDVVWEMKK
jgi:hypothetical protein